MWKNYGHCVCCNDATEFVLNGNTYRDHYVCSKCGSIPRQRALMNVILMNFPEWEFFSIHESSPSGDGASCRLRNGCQHYLATQYYDDVPLGKSFGWFQNEDLEQQTFPDESFDLVVTQDVMEHLFYPERAFAEIARTLKPGGAHVFTVPLINQQAQTEKWAVLENKEVHFLHTAEYHGNPISEKGSPVTYHWGYDIMDFIYKSSGMTTRIFETESLELGIRGQYCEVLVSYK